MKCVVVDEFGAIVEKRSEVDGIPMAFIPVRDVPDGFDPMTPRALVGIGPPIAKKRSSSLKTRSLAHQ